MTTLSQISGETYFQMFVVSIRLYCVVLKKEHEVMIECKTKIVNWATYIKYIL